ncbi:MAG: recombinase RecA [Candidatus Dependentiae bacterium]|nr:recombinase RecA [Candidatus Dependentiae bacterium]
MKQKNVNVDELDFRKKSLEVTFAQIHKQYGKGSVMLLGDTPVVDIKSISTGSLLIDEAIGVSGLPCGRIVEVFGPESSGKTTLALQTIAQAQKAGGTCAFIDAEHALDPKYAEKLGVNIDDLIISQPDFGEQALDIAEMLVRSNAVDLIVIDSVAALVPKAELEGEMGDAHVGLQARLMSQALRKLTSIIHKSNAILLFINQVRQTISGMSFGPKETTSGGKALKFYASVRLDIRKIASLKKNEEHFGNRVAIKVVKNKVAAPFKSVEVDLLFNEGISKELELLDMAIARNIIKQSGSWFSFGDVKLAQGREQVLNLFKEDKKTYNDILIKVRETLKVV